MTTTLAISFPWGQYHATPWDRGANEGIVEWPPSPWRLLRALYSSWKVHSPHLGASVVEGLLSQLSDAPTFVLPPHREAHTRHYMPDAKHHIGLSGDTVKTLDTFVVTNRDATIWVEWPVSLDDEHLEALRQLAEGVRYLGRAESIVEVAVVPERGDGAVVAPGESAGSGTAVRLLTPSAPFDVGSLVQTTVQIRKQRQLNPTGTQWASYVRPEAAEPERLHHRLAPRVASTMRFAIADGVLPSRFDAVVLGDLVRRSCMSRHGDRSETFAGKDVNGTPLRGLHGHAHYISLTTGFSSGQPQGGDRLDTVVVWAPGGFDESEIAAAEALRDLRSAEFVDGVRHRRVTLLGTGSIADTAPELVGPSAVWQSVTPYSPVHHHRGSLEKQLLADVCRELESRGLPPVVEVALVEGPWLQFRRYRPGKERIQRSRPAYGLRLQFASQVEGPIAIGQLSHFGLGLFSPVAYR